jgi:hypothetical protein
MPRAMCETARIVGVFVIFCSWCILCVFLWLFVVFWGAGKLLNCVKLFYGTKNEIIFIFLLSKRRAEREEIRKALRGTTHTRMSYTSTIVSKCLILGHKFCEVVYYDDYYYCYYAAEWVYIKLKHARWRRGLYFTILYFLTTTETTTRGWIYEFNIPFSVNKKFFLLSRALICGKTQLPSELLPLFICRVLSFFHYFISFSSLAIFLFLSRWKEEKFDGEVSEPRHDTKI